MKLHQHLHLRKRLPAGKAGLEPYPSNKFRFWVLDHIVYLVGIIGPVMTLPQLLLIYGQHQAAGISPVSWATWALFDIPWIIYGFAHRERPIVFTYTLWLIANTLVFVGALLYG